MKQNQSGSVLAISLALLTTITLVAMMSLQRSGLQTKIVANVLHKEARFNASQNEQEFWFSNFVNNPSKHILEVINSVDAEGSPLPLTLEVSRPQGQQFPLIVNVTATYIIPGGNNIALATGEEVGTYQIYNFELDSAASFRQRPNAISAQRSSFSFPGLSISQNSL